MKRVFLIVLVAGGAYFGYGYLPADMRAKADNFAAGIGLARLNPLNLLPSMAEGTQSVKNVLAPSQNPVEKRATLIQKLEKNLATIKQQAPNPAVNATIRDSEALIAELKAENGKSGVVASITERIADFILPSPTTSSPTSSGAVICES